MKLKYRNSKMNISLIKCPNSAKLKSPIPLRRHRAATMDTDQDILKFFKDDEICTADVCATTQNPSCAS